MSEFNLRRARRVRTTAGARIDDLEVRVTALEALGPSGLDECQARVKELEAMAERYRKALHISVGIANAPVAAPSKRSERVASMLRKSHKNASIKLPAKVKSAKAPAKAPVVAAPIEFEGELTVIDGDFYLVSNGNVYEYDQMAETAGAFVGRLKPDGESIDTTAPEVMKGKTSAPAPATAAKAPEPVAATGELKMIGGKMYMVINGNVYEYDQMAETAGKFLGGLSPNGQYIDLKAARRGGSRKTRARRHSSKNRKTQNRRHK